jgi:hypothetical protein
MRRTVLLLALFAASTWTTIASGQAPSGGPLGSPDFSPSSRQPVGWRGDGSGRFPGATPPTSWQRKRVGAGYAAKGSSG